MTGTLSPDGNWLWNGTEWIPAPPAAHPNATESASKTIQQVAESNNIPYDELSQIAQYYDLNQDNSLSQYEIELAASAYHTAPTEFSHNKITKRLNQRTVKILTSLAIAFMLVISMTIWMISPEYSPLSIVHDEDGDGIPDADDMFKFNPTQWKDSDGDGYGDNQEDNASQIDAFPNNPTQWSDSDGDGYGDNQSPGAVRVDNFTNNPTQWEDFDKDGYGDNQSSGATQVDNFTNNPSQWKDSDGDGYGDNQSVGATQVDDFVNNPTQWRDTDGDGFGDNQTNGATQVDMFVDNPTQWKDSDGDGYGDNNAFGATLVDAFPNDASEWFDSDNDGWGDNTDDCDSIFGTSEIDAVGCVDSDGDGYSNNGDAFPLDPNEWIDDDNDGVGNNKDLLDNGDAYIQFSAWSIETDDSQSYDIFGNPPDIYFIVIIDDDCDGQYNENDLYHASDTKTDSHIVDAEDSMTVTYDIDDDATNHCFFLAILDDDESDDDLLDYVSGDGSYYSFNEEVYQNMYEVINYTNSGEYKSVSIEIDVYIV